MAAEEPLELEQLVADVAEALTGRGWRLAVAESCTGGLAAARITEAPGSSGWFDRGFVAYSNEAKAEMLGVSRATLRKHGAVSEQAVREMAAGALERSRAEVSVALSGVAGPGGGSAAKPVGTVCVAWALRGQDPRSERLHLRGDRAAVREGAVAAALNGLLHRLG